MDTLRTYFKSSQIVQYCSNKQRQGQHGDNLNSHLNNNNKEEIHISPKLSALKFIDFYFTTFCLDDLGPFCETTALWRLVRPDSTPRGDPCKPTGHLQVSN
eukprot:c20655_g1_i13.p1 GENE.c20655_g1_i13~~c20655_g1_i13.p1  ORF type:complete len:101 (+),score=14.02 c20655_g1_i13:101-403(+)